MKVGKHIQDSKIIFANNLQKPSKLNVNSSNNKGKADEYKDKIGFSDEGKKLSKEFEDFIRRIEDKKTVLEMLDKSWEDLDKENPYEIKLKCFVISSRIMAGDKVPQKDINFLIENEPGMYFNAILLRKQKENPEKYKSLIEDEDSQDESDGTSNVTTGGNSSNTETENTVSAENIELAD